MPHARPWSRGWGQVNVGSSNANVANVARPVISIDNRSSAQAIIRQQMKSRICHDDVSSGPSRIHQSTEDPFSTQKYRNVVDLLLRIQNPSPGRRTPIRPVFGPLLKNLHFPAGKSLFCVPMLPTNYLLFSKVYIFMKENQYFSCPLH